MKISFHTLTRLEQLYFHFSLSFVIQFVGRQYFNSYKSHQSKCFNDFVTSADLHCSWPLFYPIWDSLSFTLFNCVLRSSNKAELTCLDGSPSCLMHDLSDDDFRNYAVFFSSIKPLCGFLVSRNRSATYWFQYYSKDLKSQFTTIQSHVSQWKNNLLYKCLVSQFFPFYEYEPEFSQCHYLPHLISIILTIVFESQRGFSFTMLQLLFEFTYSTFVSDAPIIGNFLYYMFFDYYTMAIVSRYLFFMFCGGKDFFIFLFTLGRLVYKATQNMFKKIVTKDSCTGRSKKQQPKTETTAAVKTSVIVIVTILFNFLFHFFVSNKWH